MIIFLVTFIRNIDVISKEKTQLFQWKNIKKYRLICYIFLYFDRKRK